MEKQKSNRLTAFQIKLAEAAEWTNRDHWKILTLRNKSLLRYAVTLTMKQSFKVTEAKAIYWEPLDENLASAELRYLRNRLNEEVYGKKWFNKLRGRKPKGLAFVPVLQGKIASGLGGFWNEANYERTTRDYFDQDGVIHKGNKTAPRKRLQHLHWHCFIDSDLSCVWNNETKQMEEVRGLDEMNRIIKSIWNETAFGAGITKIDIKDIWDHPKGHDGWSDYISREEIKDCQGYDGNNLTI